MQVQPPTRRPVSVAQPFWASMSEEDEAYSLIAAVDRSLADCIKLLREVRVGDVISSHMTLHLRSCSKQNMLQQLRYIPVRVQLVRRLI